MKFKATVMSLVLACSMSAEASKCESNWNVIGNVISQSMTKWERIQANTSCDLDQGRMKEIQLKNVGNDGSLIEGSNEGKILESSYGETANGDLIKVSKIEDKKGKVSYNISLAMCRYSDQFASYVGEDAGMTNFQVNQISFGDNESISYGSISFHTNAAGVVQILFSGAGERFELIASEDGCDNDLGQIETAEDDNIVSSERGKFTKVLEERDQREKSDQISAKRI